MDKPNYYAVIPANVRYDKELKANEKLLYGEISALCNKNGECWATNSYFAELYNVSVRTISEWINRLKNEKYITVKTVYKSNSKEIEKRIICIEENFNAYSGKLQGGIEENFLEGIEENFQENNTSINNTSINKRNIKESLNNTEIYKEIIDYLNKKINTNYKYTTSSTQSKIKARLNEGFTIDDFKTVIDRMADEWLDDKDMSKYLRPETLFGTKFESYLNLKPKSTFDPYYNPEAEKEFYESDYYKEHVLGIKIDKKRVIEEGDPFAEYYDN